MNLSAEVKITKIKAGQASATTEVLSDVIDMANYDGVLILGTIATANAGNYLKAKQGKDAALSDAADLTGSKVIATANGETVWLDIYRPLERYLQVSVTRTVATATGDLFAIQYAGRNKPITNVVTDVLLGKLLVSPAEGTA